MQITVIVMPLPDGSAYKADAGAPWHVSSKASDPDTAFRALTDQLRPRTPAGTDFARVDVPKYDRLFDVVGGLDPDSPAWAAWASEVDAYRAEVAARDEAVEVEHGA
jgi:hypothetical protein